MSAGASCPAKNWTRRSIPFQYPIFPVKMAALELTPPGSPRDVVGPPLPIRREPPAGPDPYRDERNNARNEARCGAICPANQHGCYYFSRSEWTLCPMCEWFIGHRAGEQNGSLVYMGGPVTEHVADLKAGRAICITRAELDELFQQPTMRSFLGLVAEWHWQGFQPQHCRVFLTRKQLHNLLMTYGSPNGCLTDQLWLDLQVRWALPTA